MKRLTILIPVLLLLLVAIPSCRKYIPTQNSLSLTIVNAIPMTNSIIPVLGGDSVYYYATAQVLAFGTSWNYTPSGGSIPLFVAGSPDSTTRLYTGRLSLQTNDVYTLFFGGDSTKPDTLLTIDNIPRILIGDSSVGVRFANFSVGSEPVSVDIQSNGTAGQLIETNLGYRQAGSFHTLPATASQGGSYILEVRDQKSDTVMLTYTWNYSLYRTQTLVLAGSSSSGSIRPLQLFTVNNY